MTLTRLTGTEEKILARIKNIYERIGTRKSATDPLYIEGHDAFFEASQEVLEQIATSPRDKGSHEDLLTIIGESATQLLHAENTRPRTESRYRAEVRDHLPRFEQEAAYIKNLFELATAMGAVDKGAGYIDVMDSYTKMRTATADLIKYANRFVRGTKNAGAAKTFRDKVTNAFVATVRFREAIEVYMDARYHAVEFNECVDVAGENALSIIPEVELTQRARAYLLGEHEYHDIVAGYDANNPDMIGALLFSASHDPELVARVDEMRHRITISTSKEYLAAQRAPQSEPFDPSRISLVSSEDATLAVGNLYGSAGLDEQRRDKDTARLLM